MKVKFSQEPLQQFIYVSQTGGNNPKVVAVASGLESFLDAAILFDRMKLTKKGIVHVFLKETEEWVGSITKGKYDLPEKAIADEQGLLFKDFYTVSYKEAYPNA